MNTIISLPEPGKDLDFPLMKAIGQRRTRRKWRQENLSDQEIADLLWAACGITHNESGRSKSRRTAPSACNSQEISVYLAMQKGLFLYNEKKHQLVQIHSEDIRSAIGTQKMMHSAPLGLIYVSDFRKMNSFLFRDDQSKWLNSAADTGFISQNVYLYCAAMNLSTAVLGLVDRDRLHSLMNLGNDEKIIFTQVVGKAL